MMKFITVKDFGADFMRFTEEHPDLRILSIGTTSNGYYTFRCVDKDGSEKVFKISCWEY